MQQNTNLDDLFASRVISNETCKNLSALANAMQLKLDGFVTDHAVLNAALDLLASLRGDVLVALGGERDPDHVAMHAALGFRVRKSPKPTDTE